MSALPSKRTKRRHVGMAALCQYPTSKNRQGNRVCGYEIGVGCSLSTEAGRLLCVLLKRFGAMSADPKRPARAFQRYTKTGVFVCVRTLFVTLPSTIAESPPRPCDPMTMRSQPLSEAAAIMA